MYLLFIWGGTYGFGLREIHNEGRLKGVGPEISTFLGPEMATSEGVGPETILNGVTEITRGP
jgi:hypothetical protein